MTRFCAMWQLDLNLTNVEPRNASVKRTGNREGRELCPQGARRGQLTDHLGRAPFARATKFDPTPWSCPFIPLFPTLAGGSKVSVGSKRASRVGPLLGRKAAGQGISASGDRTDMPQRPAEVAF
jgi:hypothetical protein